MAEADHSDAEPAGLSTAQVAERLAQFGPNATPDEPENLSRRLLGKFVAPVPCLLEAAILLQLVLGEYLEAGVVGILLLFNAGLGFVQEGRAQAALAALKSRLALWAFAYRDGAWTRIPAEGLVPGDLVKLSLGEVVAADVRLLSGHVLLDQSMITGESLPVEAEAGYQAYAGALVRRGEALAQVTATGARSKFGRAAELVRTAHVPSTEERAVFRVVRNLAFVNGAATVLLIAYAWRIGMPVHELVPLMLIAVLGTVPVALPATFTLATAISARKLATQDILPTRLSAIGEAASMDLLCSDKTGTLTRNKLAVTAVRPLGKAGPADVLGLAALASSDGSGDPVDAAVRAGVSQPVALKRTAFVPFDPATKMAQAEAVDSTGVSWRIVKGAFAAVEGLCPALPQAAALAADLAQQGYRVLAVAAGPAKSMELAGLVALSDPPRPEAADCIAALRRLGVNVVVVTGDAAATAEVVARDVGITGRVYPPQPIGETASPEDYAVFAGILPEDKFKLVKAFQKAGHTVGMCGDGANDAPALRQAQIGIAVSTATDVAKAAAGLVLTRPGLAGIVTAVREGRVSFQRILTYTLRSLVNKVRQVLFLAIGLVMTGHAILTPMLMVLLMITGDFLSMSATTDNVEPSQRPNAWRIDHLTIAGVALGLCDLAFCTAILAWGVFMLRLPLAALQSLTVVALTFNGQAVFYAVRDRRRLWSSRPSRTVILSSVADLLIIPGLAASGVLMAPLPLSVLFGLLAAALVLALVLDALKTRLFRHLRMV